MQVAEMSHGAAPARFRGVTFVDAPLSLTAQEARILHYFMHHQGRIISRGELGERVGNPATVRLHELRPIVRS